MRIKCKIAPFSCAWSTPRSRFVFLNKDLQVISEKKLEILKKKFGARFNQIFELEDQNSVKTEKKIKEVKHGRRIFR